MKLINKYTELRDEIYNDLVNKIEISKKDKKVLNTTIAFQITDYRGTNKEISEITETSKLMRVTAYGFFLYRLSKQER